MRERQVYLMNATYDDSTLFSTGKKPRVADSNFFSVFCVSLQEYALCVGTAFSYMSPTRRRVY